MNHAVQPPLATSFAQKVAEAAGAVRRKWPHSVSFGIILGSGLGELANLIEAEVVIPYAEIPHFPRSFAAGHRGQLVAGELAGAPVLAMQGRSHLYEGYAAQELVLPIHLFAALGARSLIVSNACGGVNPRYQPGDVMLIADHINLLGGKLRLRNDASLRAVSAQCYDQKFLRRAAELSGNYGFSAQQGVYAAVTGPNYETRAEYRFLRRIGADVVGMSTVPEVVAASRLGMRVLALSMVANVARPDAPVKTTHEEVIEVARQAEYRMRGIVLGIVAEG